jgi:hypothetical protein
MRVKEIPLAGKNLNEEPSAIKTECVPCSLPSIEVVSGLSVSEKGKLPA